MSRLRRRRLISTMPLPREYFDADAMIDFAAADASLIFIISTRLS